MIFLEALLKFFEDFLDLGNPANLYSIAPVSSERRGGIDLFDPYMKDFALQLVSSAEHATLDWRRQYRYIKDLHDGRGYTGGIAGFTSATGDMLELVERYHDLHPGNILEQYLPALSQVNGTSSVKGLAEAFEHDWKTAAYDPLFQQAQDELRDAMYFTPAVNQALADGLHPLGQFIYYDAMIMHGPGDHEENFGGIRAEAMKQVRKPFQGGSEAAYLYLFLNARKAIMVKEGIISQLDRIVCMQRKFLHERNFNLILLLRWNIYGDRYIINE